MARGDGIGPEITEATLSILDHSGADLQYLDLEIGLKAYQQGSKGGIPDEAWKQIHEAEAILKAPITTPSGGGVKSLNVTMRKRLGLAVNLRPARALAPYVQTHYPGMDLVVVRENEEDLYAGIEYQASRQSVSAIKLITRPGCERVIRYAFDYAQESGREKVSALIKDNIMKMSDGMFFEVFEEIAAEYPDIEAERLIVDIGMARVADTPERFEVIVCENLYGDILSDITAQLSGSVGLCGSANLGERYAMFEAIHGSAPDIAGQDIANPSGMLQGAVMMLEHLGQAEPAKLIQNAWLRTLEDGINTPDLESSHTTRRVGTQGFSEAVVERLGMEPKRLHPARPGGFAKVKPAPQERQGGSREICGIDIFLHYHGPLDELTRRLGAINTPLHMESVSCRGMEVWPQQGEALLTDHLMTRWRGESPSLRELTDLQLNISRAGIETVGTENLYLLDGQEGFSPLQGS